MNKILPQFKYVTLWQSVLLAFCSVLFTWWLTIYSVVEYVDRASGEVDQLGGLSQIAITTLDATVVVFGLGIYFVAGIACLILLSINKRLRASPIAQSIWALFILIGLGVSMHLGNAFNKAMQPSECGVM